jgi:hypothetical protein
MSFRNIFQIVFFRLLYVYGIYWNRILNLCKLLQGLKKKLRANWFIVSNYYVLGSRKCNIIHTRLRHQCSLLGADLFRANIVNDPSCGCLYMINKSGWGKGGKGIECKCMIAFLVQSKISYHPNLWYIYC